MKTVKFGLRVKGTDELLKYTMFTIKGSEEEKDVYELSENGENEWLLEDVNAVRMALKEEVKWFQTSFEIPLIKQNKEELEVVQVTQIMKVEVYDENSIYENLDNYHRQKVEEAMRKLEMEEMTKPKQEEFEEETIEFVSTVKEVEPKTELPTQLEESNIAVAEKGHTIKAKVKCLKDIPKEMGSVRLKSDPVSNCFREGKSYLAYTRNEKLFIMNEDKVPEFICNAKEEKKWEDNFFFNSHFVIEEYLG